MCTRTGTADGPGRGSKERKRPSPPHRRLPRAKQPKTSEARQGAREDDMGKYMRKCRGAAVGEEVTQQAVGVRTRSRAAAGAKVVVVVSKRIRKPLSPSPLRRVADAAAASSMGEGESGSCYLKLRSRMLFMVPPSSSSTPAPAHGAQGAGHVAAGLSRCDSTASSVDASAAAAQDRSTPCRSDAAEAGSDNVRQQGSASDNSENGGRGDRERRETTPSSHRLPSELSDLESDLAGQNGSRSLPSALTSTQVRAAARARMPPAAEIEEFFAAAEEAEASRFASKYNFDVARGVPLDAGRFEWAPAVSSN